MSMWTDELWENDANEKLFKLIFVIFLLQQNVGHRADHVQGAVLLRRGGVRVLQKERNFKIQFNKSVNFGILG